MTRNPTHVGFRKQAVPSTASRRVNRLKSSTPKVGNLTSAGMFGLRNTPSQSYCSAAIVSRKTKSNLLKGLNPIRRTHLNKRTKKVQLNLKRVHQSNIDRD